jgi:uncharacterized membrane-anchored protein YjiN (DUF445 family)
MRSQKKVNTNEVFQPKKINLSVVKQEDPEIETPNIASNPKSSAMILYIAHGILILAVIGFIAALQVFGTDSGLFSIFFIHAFEGALVGGMCDWFAVSKTFSKIEEQRDDLADEIGKFISEEIIGSEKKIKDLIDEKLADPILHKEVSEYLEHKFPNPKVTRAILEENFDWLYEKTVDVIMEFKFKDSGGLGDVALERFKNDERIVKYLKQCVAGALKAVSKKDEVNQFAEASSSLASLATFFGYDFRNLIKTAGKKITNTKPDPEVEELVKSLIQASADGYKSTWDKLPPKDKREAVEALIAALKDIVIHQIAEIIVSEKHKISDYYALKQYAPIRETAKRISSFVTQEAINGLGTKIALQLKKMHKRDFRIMMEQKTLNTFQWIRINGTVLGFFLGGAIGLLLHFLKN